MDSQNYTTGIMNRISGYLTSFIPNRLQEVDKLYELIKNTCSHRKSQSYRVIPNTISSSSFQSKPLVLEKAIFRQDIFPQQEGFDILDPTQGLISTENPEIVKKEEIVGKTSHGSNKQKALPEHVSSASLKIIHRPLLFSFCHLKRSVFPWDRIDIWNKCFPKEIRVRGKGSPINSDFGFLLPSFASQIRLCRQPRALLVAIGGSKKKSIFLHTIRSIAGIPLKDMSLRQRDWTGQWIDPTNGIESWEILTGIKRAKQLKKLTLHFDVFESNARSFKRIGKELRLFKTLETLNIIFLKSGKSLVGMQDLAQYWYRLPRLRHLNISFGQSIDFTIEGEKQTLSVLMERIKTLPDLVHLHLSFSDVKIIPAQLEQIGQALKNKRLKSLSLDFAKCYNPISSASSVEDTASILKYIAAFVETLEDLCQFKLKMPNSSYRGESKDTWRTFHAPIDSSIISLAKAIAKLPLENLELSLRTICISPESFHHLSNMVERLAGLQVLSLDFEKTKLSDITDLAKSIQLKTLQKLVLNFNKNLINEASAMQLAHSLSSLSKLKVLKLELKNEKQEENIWSSAVIDIIEQIASLPLKKLKIELLPYQIDLLGEALFQSLSKIQILECFHLKFPDELPIKRETIMKIWNGFGNLSHIKQKFLNRTKYR